MVHRLIKDKKNLWNLVSSPSFNALNKKFIFRFKESLSESDIVFKRHRKILPDGLHEYIDDKSLILSAVIFVRFISSSELYNNSFANFSLILHFYNVLNKINFIRLFL